MKFYSTRSTQLFYGKKPVIIMYAHENKGINERGDEK
jgi:hypothetical protein